MKSFLAFFLYLFFALLLDSQLHAQTGKDLRAKAPPPPVPQKASLDRGQTVVIPLAVYGAGAAQMEFIIRTLPKHGAISRVRITGATSAAVSYTAPAKTSALEDRFTYAVRTPDGVSAAVPVVISIIEPLVIPPRLVVPGSLEGGNIYPGDEGTIVIPVKNSGGGYAEGEFKIAAPWTVLGLKKFRLAGGESIDVTITFSETKIGPHQAELSYGPAHRVSSTLNFKVISPLTVAPSVLNLKGKPGVFTRSGQVMLTNDSSRPVAVAVKHGGRLLTEQSITIPALDSRELAVFAEPDEVGKIEEQIEFGAGEWKHSLPVVAEPLGPIVSLREKSVAFAGATVGRTTQSSITLENKGGTMVALTLKATGPFRSDPTAIALKPKDTAVITVLCNALIPGLAEGELSIKGTDVEISIPLSTEVAAQELATKPPPAPATVAEKIETAPETNDEDNLAAQQPSSMAELPNMRGKAIEVTARGAVVEWISPQKNGLRAQSRILTASENAPAIHWKDISAKFAPSGAMMRCTIDSLTPKSLHTVRIISEDGVECTVNFITKPSPPYLRYFVRTTLLIAAIAAAVFYIRKRRAEQTQHY